MLLQELLAAQGALLEQTQASLQECQSQSTRIEARAALREERQRSIIARLQEGHACVTAEVSIRLRPSKPHLSCHTHVTACAHTPLRVNYPCSVSIEWQTSDCQSAMQMV